MYTYWPALLVQLTDPWLKYMATSGPEAATQVQVFGSSCVMTGGHSKPGPATGREPQFGIEATTNARSPQVL